MHGNNQILAIEGTSREMAEAGIVEEGNEILAKDQFNEVVKVVGLVENNETTVKEKPILHKFES